MKKAWQKKRLVDVTTKIGSGATPRGGDEAYKADGISLIRSLNVYDDGFRAAKLARIDSDQADRLSSVVVEPYDVLLNITGASIARCCRAPSDFLPARVNQHVSIIRPVREKLDSRFLHYLLISNIYKDRLLHTGDGGGSTRQAITKAQLQQFVVEFPESLAEQQRIVSILDEAYQAVATAKTNAEQNLSNAGALFESRLESVVTQRGPGRVEKRLDEVCAITSTLVDPRKDQYCHLIHVGAGNIESKTGILVNLRTAGEEGLISGKFLFDNSMVLYSKIRPYLMKIGRPEFSGLCSADMYPLTPNANVITRDYLFHLLRSKDFTDYAIEGSARAGMPKVNREHLFDFRAWLPSVNEQERIATKLDELHEATQRLSKLYERKLKEFDALKKSLLHQAFSGQL